MKILVMITNFLIALVIQFLGIEILTAITADTDATRYFAQAVWIVTCIAAFIILTLKQLRTSN